MPPETDRQQILTELTAAAVPDGHGRLWCDLTCVRETLQRYLADTEPQPEAAHPPHPSVSLIIHESERLFGVSALREHRGRSKPHHRARMTAAIAMAELRGMGQPEIAAALNYASHSSIVNLIQAGRQDDQVAHALLNLLQRFGFVTPQPRNRKDSNATSAPTTDEACAA